MTPQLDPLHNKRVAILGFARQGRALARWLPTVGARVVDHEGGAHAEEAADGEPLEHAAGEEHRDALGEGEDQRRERHQGQGGQQQALAPEAVAQVARDQHRGADGHRVGDEQQRRRARRDAEVRLVERQ